MKTIDVRLTDQWRKDVEGDIWQVRGMWNRCITSDVIGSGAARGNVEWPKSEPITTAVAHDQLLRWGYTLTPGEGEKPECQPKATSPVLTAERTEKPAPQENKNDVKSCFRDATAPTVKPDVTVDAVELSERMDELETQLDTMETFVTIRDARLAERLEKVEAIANCKGIYIPAAPKPAARVVKAPKPPVYGDGDWLKGVQWEAKRWVDTLTSQGFTVADDNSTQH